ncbi:MAG: magnesium transporter [Thermoplasmata archaeon]|nr:magnesium transporter [Thermoplasmata archaeon]
MLAWLFTERQIARDIKESLFSLVFCTFGDLITGVTVGFFTDKLHVLPALLVLIPPAIGMRGNIFASLGSRLGTYLHTGEVVLGKKSELIKENVNASFALTFSMSIYIGILAWIIAHYLGMDVSLIDLALISILAGIFSAFLMIFFTFLIAFLSFKRGWNPDNITAPLITLAGDIITLPLLFFSLEIVLLLDDRIKLMLFVTLLAASIVSLIHSSLYKTARRILIESIPVLAICGLLSSFSGTILGAKFEGIMETAAILTIIPAFLEDGGAIGGILAARFSSALHLGEVGEKHEEKVWNLFIVMHLVGLVIFPLIGIFGYIAGSLLGLGSYNILKMVAISLIAGEIVIFIVNFLAYFVSIKSYKAGIDPDNVAIPILTSLMDFIGIACLIGVAFLLNPG